MAKASVNFLSQLGRKKLINHPQKMCVCVCVDVYIYLNL